MKANFEVSNQMAKAIKSESKTFTGIRRNVLAAIKDAVIKGNNISKVLDSSKKDSELFKKLVSLAAYQYAGEETEGGLSIVKRYSEKSVLNAAELYLVEDCTPKFIATVEAENKAAAIEACKSQVESAKAALEIAIAIQRGNTAKEEDVINKLAARIESATKNIARKEAILAAVLSL
jgi:hypothetical protein